MKRAIVLAAAVLMLAQASALAQERPPLAMQIEFEWTVIGTVSGAVIGAMIWLTDPANPSNVFSDSISSGAAWGTIIGAGFGLFILQRTAQFPQTLAGPPPAAHPTISADPVGVASGESPTFGTLTRAANPAPGITLPVLNLRF